MVRGKQQLKTVQVRKTPASKKESAPHSSPNPGSQKKIPSCCGCGKIITDDTKALQCDKCHVEKWKCIDCLSLSAQIYDHLITEPSCNLRWFCDGCDRAVMETEANKEAASCWLTFTFPFRTDGRSHLALRPCMCGPVRNPNMTKGQENLLVASANWRTVIGLTLPNSSASMVRAPIMEYLDTI